MNSLTTRQAAVQGQRCCSAPASRTTPISLPHPGAACRHKSSRRTPAQDLSCQAAAGLSTYPLMERIAVGNGARTHTGTSTTSSGHTSRCSGASVGNSQTWLASCVRHIVASSAGQLGRVGPSLQLVFGRPSHEGNRHHFQAIPVSQEVADNPQSWTQFSNHVRSSSAVGLVLVRPISHPDQHCIYASAPSTSPKSRPSSSSSSASSSASSSSCCSHSSSSACSVPPATAPCAEPISPASAAAAGAFEGQVGDCCDNTPSSASSASSAEAPACSVAAQTGSTTCYFGLVVQGSCRSDADGCWVLKTTSAGDGVEAAAAGLCTCTHFSLTRVCKGQPLYEQLRDAWLV
ncbi:hypothetical protein Agub_g12910 [Astrephomene gubernaculifera]|uniref:Uncharacterized protein n=1 Tax=Astrephomene gubernaculifera TaxID=47775 RepID=A0AAD3HRV8_9CHLO|nr:hypothetical protein Agub_g12910 [Astrephomene gubernaculifera]